MHTWMAVSVHLLQEVRPASLHVLLLHVVRTEQRMVAN